MRRAFVALLFLLLLVIPRAASAQSGNFVVYAANSDRQLFSIDLTRGTLSPLGLIPVRTQAIEQDPATGYVYYFERTLGGDEFGYWNPATGTSTRVRLYVPAPGIFAKRLAFAPGGTLYLMSDDDVLWIINKLTGDLTRLGLVAGLVSGQYNGTGDITFGPDGTLYLNTYQNVYTVDIPSLTATPLHLNALAPGQIGSGLAYCDDALYASVLDEPAALVRVVRIDVASGAVSPVLDGTPTLNDLTTCLPGVPPPPPAPPSGLSAQATSSTRIVLRWQDNSNTETAFRIERRVGTGAFQYLATARAGATTYTNTGLQPSTTYTYRVYGFNNGGHSEYTNEATATPTPPGNAPVGQILSPATGTSYQLGASVSYSGTGTDVEDGTLPDSAFVWDVARSGTSTFHRLATGVKTGSFLATTAGTFVIRLTVTDSSGLTSRPQVTITVQ